MAEEKSAGIIEKIKDFDDPAKLQGFKKYLQSKGDLDPDVAAAISEREASFHNSPFSVTADELRQFIERIENMEAEKKEVADQIKEIYAELKGRGFDGKAIRKIVSLRKKDADARREEDAILSVYMTALGME